MVAMKALLVAGLVQTVLSCTSKQRGPNPGLDLQQLIRDTLERRDKARELKRQAAIPLTTPFPCDLAQGRSAVRPTSVHHLRPGDIDVVGALGDSLTAGFGAISLDIPCVIWGNRGMSFSIGGAETWRTVFTLPNVLKLYNPKLVGFSLGDGSKTSSNSQFNVAEGLASSTDLLFQAQLLVTRIRNDRRVNFKEDWKMVTIFMGANDFCHWICYLDPKHFIANHRKELIVALNYLRDSLPRLFINFIPPPNIYKRLLSLAQAESCHGVNILECSCMFNPRYRDKLQLYDNLMNEWQKVDYEITSNPEYLNREDFAVVVQPFMLDAKLPRLNRTSPISGKPIQDSTFFAPDCFHFSQKLHAVAGNALWNNMMQPVGSKSRGWNQRLLEDFICPNKTHSYFYTRNNSAAILL